MFKYFSHKIGKTPIFNAKAFTVILKNRHRSVAADLRAHLYNAGNTLIPATVAHPRLSHLYSQYQSTGEWWRR